MTAKHARDRCMMELTPRLPSLRMCRRLPPPGCTRGPIAGGAGCYHGGCLPRPSKMMGGRETSKQTGTESRTEYHPHRNHHSLRRPQVAFGSVSAEAAPQSRATILSIRLAGKLLSGAPFAELLADAWPPETVANRRSVARACPER